MHCKQWRFLGKWLALEFKIRFWNEYFSDYETKCSRWDIKTWIIDYFYKNNLKIINFPTKNLYKLESKIIWIEQWLCDLCLKIEEWLFDDEIIYMPKLWSSQWWLRWENVFPLIKEKLLAIKNDKVKFIICEDYEAWEIERSILNTITHYQWNELSESTLENIKKDLSTIKRLRDLLNIKWVWDKTYEKILLLGTHNHPQVQSLF